MLLFTTTTINKLTEINLVVLQIYDETEKAYQ